MGEILDLKEVAALITKLEAFASWRKRLSRIFSNARRQRDVAFVIWDTQNPAACLPFRASLLPHGRGAAAFRSGKGAPAGRRSRLTVWNHYADASEQFFAGVWASTRGRWRVRYTEHELCICSPAVS